MFTTHRKQCKRYDTPGDFHFLTFSCYQRRPLLNRERSRQWMINALSRGQELARFELIAYVIMPEHVHLVVLPMGETKVSAILTTIKQSVSKTAIHWLKDNAPEYLKRLEDRQPSGRVSYRLWQRGGGYDRNLRSVSDIHEKIRYIHENPVRRGLCGHPREWIWSSAKAWETGIDFPLKIHRERLPTFHPFG